MSIWECGGANGSGEGLTTRISTAFLQGEFLVWTGDGEGEALAVVEGVWVG